MFVNKPATFVGFTLKQLPFEIGPLDYYACLILPLFLSYFLAIALVLISLKLKRRNCKNVP